MTGQAGNGRPQFWLSLVEAYVLTARLAPEWEREFMAIRGEITEPIQRRCGPMGNHPLVPGSFPRRYTRLELEPRRPQILVIRDRCTSEAVHAVRDALENGSRREPLQRRLGDAALLGLTARDQTPLLLGDGGEPVDGLSLRHSCILGHI